MVTWAGVHCRSWWSLLQSVLPASACTSWIDHGSRQSGPVPHRMAGAIEATWENTSQWRMFYQNICSKCCMCAQILKFKVQMCTNLSWVLIRCSEGAVGVSGVQTGSIHVAVSNICLFQHVLKAFHWELGPSKVLKELLRVKIGPSKRVFTSEKLKAGRSAVRLAMCCAAYCVERLSSLQLVMTK